MGHFLVARRILGPERRREAGLVRVLCVWYVRAPRRNGGEVVEGDGGASWEDGVALAERRYWAAASVKRSQTGADCG